MKIWLDDQRPAPDGWILVKTADDAIAMLSDNPGDVTDMSFDHDLGMIDDGLAFDDYADTGYDVVCWIELQAANGNWDLVPANMYAHSGNPVGRKNLQAAIDSIDRMRNG